MNDFNRILEFEKNLSNWFIRNEYKGHDPYQLDEKVSGLLSKMPFLKYTRKALKPFHVFIPNSAFQNLPKIYHPKALGLIIGGNSYLYKITGDKELLENNKTLLELLIELRNKDYNRYAWGSPFEWGSEPRYPVNTPAVCLIIPIANSLLDYYEFSRYRLPLDICIDIIEHILKENGYSTKPDGSICLNYSPLDKNEVVNSNALAAGFFFRLSHITGDKEIKQIAQKITEWVIKSQLEDGSWHYGNMSKVIDNRHTGFILESLGSIKNYWDYEKLKIAYSRGMEFYINKLTENGLPKWSCDTLYPIDIHDVAQALLTYIADGKTDLALSLANFAIEKMSNGEDEFYFKYFKNGKVNRNVFIRWGQAWMYYALVKIIYKINSGKIEESASV